MQDSDKPLSSALKERFEKFEFNARQRTIEKAELARPIKDTFNADWYKRNTYVPTEPILIASTEDIGTFRVRANHIDAVIHYTQEQVQLKKANAPL